MSSPTKVIRPGLKSRLSKRNSSLVQNLGPLRHAPTTSGYKPKSNEKLISETILDAPLGKVAYVLYGDDTSILGGILAKLKNFDFSPDFQNSLNPSTESSCTTKIFESSCGTKQD